MKKKTSERLGKIWDAAQNTEGMEIDKLPMLLGRVSNNLNEEMSKALGKKTKAEKQYITLERARHINERHGIGNEKDFKQIPVTKEIFMLVPDVLDNFDSVEKGSKSYNLPSVKIAKHYSDGTVVVADAVLNNKNLTIKTMWVKKPDTVRQKLGSGSRLSSESSDLTELGSLAPSNQGTHPATDNIQNSKEDKSMGKKSKAKPVRGLGTSPFSSGTSFLRADACLRVFKPDPKSPGKKIYQTAEGELIATKIAGTGTRTFWVFEIPGDMKHDVFLKHTQRTHDSPTTQYQFQIKGFPEEVGYSLSMAKETSEKLEGFSHARFNLVDQRELWRRLDEGKAAEAEIRNSEIERKISERFPGASDRVIVASPNLNAEKASSKEAGFAKAARIPKSSGDIYRKIVFVSQALANEKHTSRPALAFLKVEKSDGATDIVATDSHILNHARFEAGEAPAIDSLEPGLYRIAKGKDDAALMQADCDAAYPDWRSAIPKESELDAVAGSFSFGSKDEVNFATSIYRLARAGYCANVSLLKLLEGFSWGAKLNKEKTLAVFENAKGDCKSLVMAIKTDETEAMNGLFDFSDRRQSCR